MLTDAALMLVAEEQIDWIADKFDGSREAGRLALLSVLMTVRDDAAKSALAPELLDRVKDAVLVLEAIRENWGDDHPGLLRTIDEELPPLRAAIAKAESR